MADLRVSELPALAGSDLAAADVLPVADLSASETRKLTAKELIQNGVALIDNGSLPGDKITSGSITAVQIGTNAVGASELADGAVDTAAILDLAVTNSKIAPGVDGAKLTDDTVTAAKIPAGSLNRGIDKTGGAIGHTNAIAASVRSGISYDAQGHITAAVALVPSDLPVATDALKGAVIVPAASGLNVSGAGELSHQSSIAAGTTSGITYNATGHITAVVKLAPGDLPIATATTDGVVKVPGPALSVDSNGTLAHVVSPVAPGAYPKVTVDARGHVTAGQMLAGTDIPSIDATKINTGVFDPARLADRSITQEKLADYAISFIQESSPGAVNAYHNGMLWFQESTGQLRMWNGNSWFPVGFGRLSAENLRYCGTFDASTGLITGVTQFGTTEGFKIGDAIPAATDAKSGVYFVCTTPGNATPVVAGVAFDNGDWVLCNGLTAGWVRVDTLNGGGGGGGASQLDDLLDVTLTLPSAGDRLVFGTGGQWVNDKPATQAEVDAGVDASKIVTPKTLQDAVISCGTF